MQHALSSGTPSVSGQRRYEEGRVNAKRNGMARKRHELELALRKLYLHRANNPIYIIGLMESPGVSGITDVTPTQVDGWY